MPRQKKVNSYINNGVAININSKNPERAMMVLNEFYTNPAVYDLAMLGIEGKHWEAVGSDQYKIIDETNKNASEQVIKLAKANLKTNVFEGQN